MIAISVILALFVAWLILLACFARRLRADWREPVLASPVLIIESDDWGPGPPTDAERLQQLFELLRTFRDGGGHSPVITLGLVLAVPGDVTSGQTGAARRNVRRILDDNEFTELREAMLAGREGGCFALQLHGMEHYWLPTLLRVAEVEPSVRSFLSAADGVPRHESLPSHLQARWIDASSLPSVALDFAAIERAVGEETECFKRVFGESARVAVPVTFTWTSDVEASWAKHGIRVVVTPGTRNIGRDAQGRLISDGSILRNGDTAAGGIVFVVRDIYFEPALGHKAERTLEEIRDHHRLGRPALLEMHRFSFTGDAAQAKAAYAELSRLLEASLATIPQLRFMSTDALAQAMIAGDPKIIDRRFAARVRALVLRAARHSRLRKLAWLSGLALVAIAALAIASTLLRRSVSAERIRG